MREMDGTTLQQIQAFRDIPVPIEVRIGSRICSVEEIATLRDGSILVLDKPAGETLDMYVDGFRFAAVEVVAVDDRVAVRIAQLYTLSPEAAPVPGELERVQ